MMEEKFYKNMIDGTGANMLISSPYDFGYKCTFAVEIIYHGERFRAS